MARRSDGRNFFVKKSQLGLGLIETMVSLFVLAFGLLSLSALQVSAIKQNQNSYYRTQASNLAYEIIDRMRVNRDEAKRTGAYISSYGQAHGGDLNCSNGCKSSEMADYDLMNWKRDLKKMLPKGQGGIRFFDKEGVRSVSVSIRFDYRLGKNSVVEPVVIWAVL